MPNALDHLQLDNVGGARLATQSLIERGCRSIAVLGGSSNREWDMPFMRQEGWRIALEEAGLSADPDLIVPLQHFSSEEAMGELASVLERRSIDGVFAVTDTVALGALAALREARLSVPADVQVCGFDNLESSRFAYPGGLTTVGPLHDELPRLALDLLDRRIADAEAPAQHVVVGMRMYARATTR